jgi:hypothetical protein
VFQQQEHGGIDRLGLILTMSNPIDDLQIRNKGDAELLVDHQGKDAHLCSTALIELDGVLLELGLLIKSVPAKINESIAEVTDEIVLTSGILHEAELEGANEGDDLCNAS